MSGVGSKVTALLILIAAILGVGVVVVPPLQRVADRKAAGEVRDEIEPLRVEHDRYQRGLDGITRELELRRAVATGDASGHAQIRQDLVVEMAHIDQLHARRHHAVAEIRRRALVDRASMVGREVARFTTADGRVIENVKVVEVSDHGVTLENSDGRWRLRPHELAERMKIRLRLGNLPDAGNGAP